MTRPLAGLRVLDLGTRIAAPFCAGLLGEQGAEVIKIEQPRRRRLHARDRSVRRKRRRGDPYSLFWAVEGRGRKSVTLDLRTPDGQDVLRRLAATADVLVENFRPGTLEQWNIGPSILPERLVTVRISMFGQDGPYSPRPGLDRVGIGYGGLLHLTGLSRPPAGARRRHDLRLPHRRVRGARRGRPRCTGATTRGQSGAVIDAALYGVGAAHPRVDARRRTTGSASCATARAIGSRTRRRSTTTRPPTASTCASSPVPMRTSPGCARRWTGSTCSTTRASRSSPTAPRTATRSTASSPSGPRRSTRRSSRGAVRRARRSGRDRVHRGRHLRRPALRAARRSRDRRRPRRSASIRQQAPFPRRVGEKPAVPDGRAAARRAHRRGARARSGSRPPRSTRCATQGVV